MSNVMVVYMGLKNIRCIIFSGSGLKLGSASMAINDKQVEQDPEEWTRRGKQVMRKALWDATICQSVRGYQDMLISQVKAF